MELEQGAGLALVAIGPFVAAALAPLLHGLLRGFSHWLLALVPAAIFVFLMGYVGPVASGETIVAGIDWVPALGLRLTFLVDGLSLAFAMTISGIGTLIVLYAGAYLHGHRHLGRFLMFLLAFTGAMLGLVLSDNLLALFLFWELTSISSFLLIGFDGDRQAARRGAIQALVITNIGGMGLLVGVILISQLTGGWSLAELLGSGDILRDSGLYGAVLMAILVAAFTKSAQVPFHFWLPNAMEAPTPVSAFLHSATMVQAGVYLLARMTPVLGGTTVWTTVLVVFGCATLIWGALGALRQTDLKQMLAQTTIASLGLLVVLIGLGTPVALSAFVLYFAAHALYKAALFMVAGAVDHEAGTRDITALGGLAERMPATFIGAALAGLSMFSVPATLGFFAKEEMYLDLVVMEPTAIAVLLALVLGNALLGGVGLIVMIRPFLGPAVATPKAAHEAPLAMLVGPIVLGTAGVVSALMIDWFGHDVMAPAASAVAGQGIESHIGWAINFASPALWASVVTWVLAVVVYRQADSLRTLLRRWPASWNADNAFDAVMFGLFRFAGAVTRTLHHGRLELYLVVVFIGFALAVLVPLIGMGGIQALMPTAELGNWGAVLRWPSLQPYEWIVVTVAVVGLVAVLTARNRLVAIVALGIQGTGVALIFLLFGAPDLAFTQFMVEILSVVILTLVMTRLRLDERDKRPFEDWVRDGAIAVACGLGVSLTLMVILTGPLDTRLSDFFIATSVPVAHGANIVNVILVDYRGFDTLGEISVVMAAGIAIMVLLRSRKAPPPAPVPGPEPETRPTRAKAPKPKAARRRKVADA